MRRILPFRSRPVFLLLGALLVLAATAAGVWFWSRPTPLPAASWSPPKPPSASAAPPLASAPPPAAASPLAGIVREPLIVEYSVAGGPKTRLETMVTRPAAPGRYPMVVISHGAPRDPAERPTMTPNGTSGAAVGFARRGWIAISPMRRGYGKSSEDYVEGVGTCEDPDYRRAGLNSGQDILAATEALRANPHADPNRLLLVGVSAGGLASLGAASAMPRGLVGVISFAGGRGSTGPDTVCTDQRLVDAVGVFGRTVRAPALWIYSENDHFFGPDLAWRMYAAYTGSGAPGTFIKAPPYKQDGHELFSDPDVWNGWVDKFLRDHDLPTWKAPIVAKTANLPTPAGAGPPLVEGFEKFLQIPRYSKAFALSADSGAWGVAISDRREQAIEWAIDNCNTYGKGCRLYAIDDALAP